MIALLRDNPRRWGVNDSFYRNVYTVTHVAAPFFKSNEGTYVHRIRSARYYARIEGSRFPGHYSLSLFCGQIGYPSKGRLIQDPGQMILCATCEGRAVGAGMDPVGLLVKKPVKFAPRSEVAP